MIRVIIYVILTVAISFGNSEKLNETSHISGRVVDQENIPVPYANCFLKDNSYGAMTDSAGFFYFFVNDTGRFALTVMSMGYKTFFKDIILAHGDSLFFNIKIEPEILSSDAVTVSGSRIIDSEKPTVSLTQMQIFLTPGGAGDVYQSLKTHSGITQVSESAELYVRGGDPSETTTLLDQGILSHPYTFESPHGGLFSMINTVILKNADFSAGGFSAKYGNSLSGILVLETNDNPSLKEMSFGLALSGLSINGTLPVIPSKAGFRFAARKTMTNAITSFNGHDNFFILEPQSFDINTGFCYRYNNTGKIKATYIQTEDKQAVPVQLPQYRGIFSGNSKNVLINLQHQDIFYKKTLVQSAASVTYYRKKWQLGILDLSQTDKIVTYRTDLNTEFSDDINFRYGWEFLRNDVYYNGKTPKYEYDMRPDAEHHTLDYDIYQNRYGGYGEAEIKWSNFYTLCGLRFDYMPVIAGHWFDPRFSLGYRFAEDAYLQFNSGIFQQAPPLNENTKEPMRAIHNTLTYHVKPHKLVTVNLAAYHKKYSRLPLQFSENHYQALGHGYAYGLDSEIKFQNSRFQGWLTYSYLDSKRLWKNFEHLSPSSFAVAHTLTLITKMDLGYAWQVGINFKTASGRPYTPIHSAEYDKEYNIYIPQYGSPNSHHYPSYHRLDFRLLYLRNFYKDWFTVFYLEAMNLLNIANTMNYSYAPDYSSRSPIRSFFSRRTIVFGVTVTL